MVSRLGVNRGPAKNLIFLLVTTSENIWENPQILEGRRIEIRRIEFRVRAENQRNGKEKSSGNEDAI
jgi:hypothetical protein